ncbi:hypothetical protein ASPTUDRAFT_47590 [Aspergillus tubingensis CBS 134.48]|uniref:Uncharacterized protein n=1 Tax=Aspergillus tubingensis (strain CBS 134.48) TaxID=767770 RepID=A0A1L9MUE8_ASPTC|nr:hypothetical protein ASPTUDRAFT_47590 [Aspergillus tubingensis CBS 134.48]
MYIPQVNDHNVIISLALHPLVIGEINEGDNPPPGDIQGAIYFDRCWDTPLPC